MKHNDFHSDLRLSLKRLKQQQALWNDSRSLVDDMERLALVTDKSTSRFSSKFDIFSSNSRPLFNSAPSLHTHPAIKDRVQTLHKAINEFTEAVDSAAATFTSSTTTSVTSPSYNHRPRMAPINLDIPKFNGDPLQWGSFELSLQSLLKHRADGFSDMDMFAIVRQAIVPSQGKTLIADMLKQGTSVDQQLDALRKMFGRPQLVIPILVQRVTEPPKTDQSAGSLRTFKEVVLDNYRALDTHLHGDLGLFMPHYLRPFLEGKLRDDWERLLFEKYPKPTMKDFSEFIEQRLLWADTQARPSYSNVPSTSSYPSSSSTTTPTSPKKKSSTPAKCASCGEAHWLGRCPAFAAGHRRPEPPGPGHEALP